MDRYRFAQRKEETVQLIGEANVVCCTGEAMPSAAQVPGPGHQFGEYERFVQAGRMVADGDQGTFPVLKVLLQTVQVPLVVVHTSAIEEVHPELREDRNAGHYDGTAESLESGGDDRRWSVMVVNL